MQSAFSIGSQSFEKSYSMRNFDLLNHHLLGVIWHLSGSVLKLFFLTCPTSPNSFYTRKTASVYGEDLARKAAGT